MDYFEDLDVYCSNFVSQKAYEPHIKELLNNTPGNWIRVSDLIDSESADSKSKYVPNDLFITWLHSIEEQKGFSMIIFCESEYLWSKIALYNQGRLSQ